MQLTGRITRDSLMTLEAYSRWRKAHKGEVIAQGHAAQLAVRDDVRLMRLAVPAVSLQCHEAVRGDFSGELHAGLPQVDHLSPYAIRTRLKGCSSLGVPSELRSKPWLM